MNPVDRRWILKDNLLLPKTTSQLPASDCLLNMIFFVIAQKVVDYYAVISYWDCIARQPVVIAMVNFVRMQSQLKTTNRNHVRHRN